MNRCRCNRHHDFVDNRVADWDRRRRHSNARTPLCDVRAALAMGTTYHIHYIYIRFTKSQANVEWKKVEEKNA